MPKQKTHSGAKKRFKITGSGVVLGVGTQPEAEALLAPLTQPVAGRGLDQAPEGLLQLQWTWGMRDVFAIANMLLIGASFPTEPLPSPSPSPSPSP